MSLRDFAVILYNSDTQLFTKLTEKKKKKKKKHRVRSGHDKTFKQDFIGPYLDFGQEKEVTTCISQDQIANPTKGTKHFWLKITFC